jgi:HAD superfamily hydrolase (TIGR01509 family)
MKTILVDAAYCFIKEKDGKFEVFKDMYNLLEAYPNRKILLTGADDEQKEKFALNDVPYPVFTLKHNPEKTDPKYYEIMLKNFNLTKDKVVYFEHNPDSLKSAQKAGIKVYFYDDSKKDLGSLKKFLDDNLK